MAALMAVLPALGAAGGAAGGIGGFASILSGIGSAVGALAAFRQGQAGQAAAEYNARIANNNAMAAEVTGMQEAGRIHDLNRRKMATAQNQYGASGALVDVGSPVDVMADLAAQGALDEEIARWRGKVNATGLRNEAVAQQFAGQQAYQAGIGRAGGMLLSGFGRIGGGTGATAPSAPSAQPYSYGYF